MNIAIGKVGKTVCIKGSCKIRTGDDSVVILLSTMSRAMPNNNFYIVGPNDLHKLTTEEYNKVFPNNNVFSVYQKPYIDEDGCYNYDSICDHLDKNNIRFDFGLFFIGMCGQANVEKCLRTKKDEYYNTLIAFKKYAGPYIHVLNKTNTPFYTIAEDPRYITINAGDLYNRERAIFTQFNAESIKTHHPHILSYDDVYTKQYSNIKCIYGEVERIFLMALDKNWKENIDIDRKLSNSKNPKCIVISNGHGCKKINSGSTFENGRFDEYNKYIIEGLKNTRFADTHIYGKWTGDIHEKYPQIQDVSLIDLGDEILDAKYSFVYSIIPGFVTIKPFEMITQGLLPFIHPEYDTNRLLNLPEFLYVTSPKDFADKMEYLENNPDEYVRLVNECIALISDEYLNGSKIINNIMRYIANDLNFEYHDIDGAAPILNHFSKYMLK